jgi:formate hydrogenlyase subunit 4
MAGLILILIAASFFPGLIVRTKSLASGRKGPGIFQPVKEIGILLRKGSVFSIPLALYFRLPR